MDKPILKKKIVKFVQKNCPKKLFFGQFFIVLAMFLLDKLLFLRENFEILIYEKCITINLDKTSD